MNEGIKFKASFSTSPSAIKIDGQDGSIRFQLAIPASEIAESVKISAYCTHAEEFFMTFYDENENKVAGFYASLVPGTAIRVGGKDPETKVWFVTSSANLRKVISLVERFIQQVMIVEIEF